MITTGKSGNNTSSFEFQIAEIFRENVVDRIITFAVLCQNVDILRTV